MRITCPSCLAQYEIEPDLLPAEGREVQCSACSHIWFQHPASATAPPAPPDPAERAPDAQDRTPDDDAESTEAPATEESAATPAPEDTERADTAPKPKSRRLDPSVADVLREEAQFEASQRQREAEGLQSQPDLGLLGGAPWPSAGADTSSDDDTVSTPHSSAGTQSAFPDIDDISATLEPAGEARNRGDFQLPQTTQARQRSFWRGFIVPPVLAALMVGLYVVAPQLVDVLPASAPVVQGYVGAIDTARDGLHSILARF
ncbi:zinc-ribbon domain-containing protein [Roseinatronobacter sp. S2]|uniref:zinc-ribbon domain-containing protein n=1 Tax=Roseinatronobacter sp. S2 TaxID=3035471 RepID=UPI00240FEF2E|nr:zinc-ribbon domain-containing protein [Roseinatronobacter sp. S2]WFE75099.1 zinc-ribbon domain-containing protein [Roseinatronobacter sp. S2]